MRSYTIEGHIPAPRPGTRTVYPWEDMEAGHSILVPWTTGDVAAYERRDYRQSAAAASARRFVRDYRPDLKVITEGFPKAQSTRIWFEDRDRKRPGVRDFPDPDEL